MSLTDINILDKFFKIGYDPFHERVLFSFGDKTFSYYPKINGWVSQHDYLPDVFFNTKKEFYSAKDNELHEHNHGERGNFYNDTYFDTIYEYVDNREAPLSKVATSLYIDSSVYDATSDLELHKTFDAYRVFNNYQDTEETAITYFADNSDNPYIGNARKTKNKWLINDLRDLKSVPQNVQASLEWAYKKKIKDHYAQVRLTKNNDLNEKLLLFRTNIIFKESIR